MSECIQQSDLKFHNRKLIYETIRREGAVSRIQLSKLTGLSATSMTRIISGLTELGMVREALGRGVTALSGKNGAENGSGAAVSGKSAVENMGGAVVPGKSAAENVDGAVVLGKSAAENVDGAVETGKSAAENVGGAAAPRRSARGAGGRHSVQLEVCAEKAYTFNIDIEGRVLRTSLMDLAHRFVVYRELAVAPKIDRFEEVAERIRDVFLEMVSFARIPREAVKCCGLTLGAHVDVENGVIVASSQFRWFRVDAKRILGGLLGLPVIVENDCKAALCAERIMLEASGRISENIAYLEMGTDGVGSAAVIDGHLLRGSFNGAGEIGHIMVQPDGEICNCGRRGCFETVLTETFVLKRVQSLCPQYQTIEMVADAAARQDKEILPLIRELETYIAIAINDISCAYNPEIVILNGSVIQKNVVNLDRIRPSQTKYVMHTIQPSLEIMTAKMGANSSLYGIGCLATDKVVSELLRG